ncbi:hypothetical protein [Methylacidimicrobium sp. AP8]|uniref:hypothetical protein n=1 Tax=Methylacidimicrobium sp. AP8 TaxID=2730359 RepID=UPI001921D9E1|nr:hypothetical protein [Methylacidimicrobium sp. AP8]
MEKEEEADRREEATKRIRASSPRRSVGGSDSRQKREEAQRGLEEGAKERAERERADSERKEKERAARKGTAKGRHIHPPEENPGAEEQSNLTEPLSRQMRKSGKRSLRTELLMRKRP